MIYEIVGVDGSGKTTLIHGLRRVINEEGIAFAYERAFQSEGVRLLEAAASTVSDKRSRPFGAFGRPVVEHVRTVELVRRSFELQPYHGSRHQHVFTDSHVIEQLGRLVQYGLRTPELDAVLQLALQSDLTLYLQLPALEAVERMKRRRKGDALLLATDPEQATSDAIIAIEAALESIPQRPIVRLDATLSIDTLLDQALASIRQSIKAAL